MGRAVGEALRLASQLGDTRRLAWIAALSAWHAVLTGHDTTAERRAGHAADLARAHPDAIQLQVSVLTAQAVVAMRAEDFSSAIRQLEAALDLVRTAQHDLAALVLLQNLSECALAMEQPTRARSLAEEGITLAASLAAQDDMADFQSQHGYAHLLLGDIDSAQQDLTAALVRHVRDASTAYALEDLLRLAAACSIDQPAQAAYYLGICHAAWTRQEEPVQRQLRTRYLDTLPTRLGDLYFYTHRAGEQLVADHGALGALMLLAEQLSTANRTSPSG
jgi:hypothetical protein